SVGGAAGAEGVQVTVRPAHCRLEHCVQAGERQVTGKLDASPDRGTGVAEVDAETESLRGSRDGSERRFGPPRRNGYAGESGEKSLALRLRGLRHGLAYALRDGRAMGRVRRHQCAAPPGAWSWARVRWSCPSNLVWSAVA